MLIRSPCYNLTKSIEHGAVCCICTHKFKYEYVDNTYSRIEKNYGCELAGCLIKICVECKEESVPFYCSLECHVIKLNLSQNLSVRPKQKRQLTFYDQVKTYNKIMKQVNYKKCILMDFLNIKDLIKLVMDY